jgi:hypothetical protein
MPFSTCIALEIGFLLVLLNRFSLEILVIRMEIVIVPGGLWA